MGLQSRGLALVGLLLIGVVAMGLLQGDLTVQQAATRTAVGLLGLLVADRLLVPIGRMLVGEPARREE